MMFAGNKNHGPKKSMKWIVASLLITETSAGQWSWGSLPWGESESKEDNASSLGAGNKFSSDAVGLSNQIYTPAPVQQKSKGSQNAGSLFGSLSQLFDPNMMGTNPTATVPSAQPPASKKPSRRQTAGADILSNLLSKHKPQSQDSQELGAHVSNFLSNGIPGQNDNNLRGGQKADPMSLLMGMAPMMNMMNQGNLQKSASQIDMFTFMPLFLDGSEFMEKMKKKEDITALQGRMIKHIGELISKFSPHFLSSIVNLYNGFALDLDIKMIQYNPQSYDIKSIFSQMTDGFKTIEYKLEHDHTFNLKVQNNILELLDFIEDAIKMANGIDEIVPRVKDKFLQKTNFGETILSLMEK